MGYCEVTSEHEIHPMAAAVDEEMRWERAKELNISISDLNLFEAVQDEIKILKLDLTDLSNLIASNEIEREEEIKKLFNSISYLSNRTTSFSPIWFWAMTTMLAYLIWKTT